MSDVSVRIGPRTLIDEVDLTIAEGSFVAIVGPNGAGKSTLLRTIYRAVRPDAGAVVIGDTDVWTARPRDVARLRAVVTQHQAAADGLLVRDIVATGRFARQRWYQRDGHGDHDAVDTALDRCRVGHLAQRTFQTLSGGERQRVLLARALAQDAPVLLLDEPTNHLDITAQLDTLTLLADLPVTRIAVLHDLDHAVAYADTLVVMHQGVLVAKGSPEEALTPDLAERVFRVRAQVVDHPITSRPHLVVAPLSPDKAERPTDRRGPPDERRDRS
ncbi:ABC transporter ATP-binding protein [Streptomyces sp. NBC_00448]|uniref:ABC transporter ATP-binding protein n=1 Tax=Streptomyces sp. NBC_00448 TaxID=2903652 RepID=UPI002E1ACBAA